MGHCQTVGLRLAFGPPLVTTPYKLGLWQEATSADGEIVKSHAKGALLLPRGPSNIDTEVDATACVSPWV